MSTSANPRLLANITQAAESKHNVEQQQQQLSQPHDAAKKDHNYFQRQYHSAVMSESIRAHQSYLQQHQQQPQPPQQPQHQHQQQYNQPKRSSPTARPRPPALTAAHDELCSCPTCSQRRLNEIMEETRLEQEHALQQQQQQQHVPTHGYPYTVSLPQTPLHCQPHSPYQRQSYGGSPVQATPFDMYGNPLPSPMQPQQQLPPSPLTNGQRGPRGRQNQPYGVAVVGYSPVSGFHGMSPMMPSSPVQAYAPLPPAGPYGSPMQSGFGPQDFEVPYIPPRDFARYAQMEDLRTSSDSPSPLDDALDGAVAVPPPPQPRVPSPLAANMSTRRLEAAVVPPQQQPPQPQPQPQPQAQRRQPRTNQQPVEESPEHQHSPKAPRSRRTSPDNAVGAPAHEGRQRRGPHGSAAAHGPTHPQSRPQCPFTLKVRTSQWHVRTVASPFPVAEGTFVGIEGDRGRDVGRVLSCGAADASEASAAKSAGPSATHPHPLLIGVAAPEDIEAITRNEADAAAAVEVAAAAATKLGLDMRVVGAVYQHDRAKLTFMYEASERVDFRHLLREMYTEYRCRIWLEVPAGSPNPLAAHKGQPAK